MVRGKTLCNLNEDVSIVSWFAGMLCSVFARYNIVLCYLTEDVSGRLQCMQCHMFSPKEYILMIALYRQKHGM